MFDAVLVANRGEIACRIIRTLRSLGIRSVAVYSDADAGARHVSLADAAVRLGTANAADSYLNIPRIVQAALDTGADAVHPGYGFLAENAEFAEACASSGLVFIGPGVEAIAVMGDKIRAKKQVAGRGVPVVPGVADPELSDSELAAAALAVGFPLLVKPSAGGGGKGMHVVDGPEQLAEAIASARREALSSFGDDTIFIERFVSRPRHIEVQVLADNDGTTVHLGERECSLQRRHQKVIEEAPSPLLDEATRARIGEAACETARSVGYRGAGTVEFIVSADAPEEFFFMEMNTRLQVEHPVTELVTGIDLVEWQLRIAAGEPLDFGQAEVRLAGHAIEARIYAEDPQSGFLPSGGRVLGLREARGDGIRVDSSLIEGLDVSADYDPMLSKVIAWAPDRDGALARLRGALRQTAIVGVTTNIEFLGLLLADEDVAAGRLDTELIGRRLSTLDFATVDDGLLSRAALILFAASGRETPESPWQARDGWRIGAHAATLFRLRVSGTESEQVVAVWGTPQRATVSVNGQPPLTASIRRTEDTDGLACRTTLGGRSVESCWLFCDDVLFLVEDGRSWTISRVTTAPRAAADAIAVPELRSPMPGAVVAIAVNDGDLVEEGAAIIVVEAMKMEHVLRATTAGRVELHATVGTQVARDQLLAMVVPPAAD
ncbi:acetyl/propionyl/methylcrotonyl-CoA carboxylase subunit alpha [Glaciihabitans sp. INWT7]|nr:acetyl/propionyl/methylcrotonyl-CoA carboxylase subunit alpha [Glaciihabitans sp. INWT7]